MKARTGRGFAVLPPALSRQLHPAGHCYVSVPAARRSALAFVSAATARAGAVASRVTACLRAGVHLKPRRGPCSAAVPEQIRIKHR